MLALAILALPATGVAVPSHIPIPQGLEEGTTVPVGGRIVKVGGSTGWMTTVLGEKHSGVEEFIALDRSVIHLPEGSIAFTVTRDNTWDHPSAMDTVLSLDDADGNSYLAIVIGWENDRFGTHLRFDAPKSLAGTGLWNNIVPLGKSYRKGDTVNVVITWGQTADKNRIYADGVKLPLDNPVTIARTFQELFGPQLAQVLVGMQHFTGWPGIVFNPLNDTVLKRLAFYEYAMDVQEARAIATPSVINSLSHDAFKVAGYSGNLVTGDSLTVTLNAEPGGEATFDVGAIKGHSMSEVSPGIYEGVHIINPGEDAEDEAVIGNFTSSYGLPSTAVAAPRWVTIDTRVYLNVKASNELVPADRSARSGLTVEATNANGKAVQGHELMLTLSTTDEYTGTVGGGTFEDLVGGIIDVDWGGVTDSFGEVTAQYISGFAAKTIMVSAKDMTSGDVGVGFVRSFIDGTVDIVITKPTARALSVAGSLDVSLSRDWLTADGRSRSRITAVVEDASGNPTSGHSVSFTLLGENGEVRVVQGKTDSRGRATADYIAGTVMGQVQVEVRDLTSGMVALVPIELRPDAPAEIALVADSSEVLTGGQNTLTATVTDANGNPNSSVDVIYNISVGNGELSSSSVATDEEGNASVVFTAGDSPGLVTVHGTVISREPTVEEISAAEGAVFLFGLDEDPGRLDVVQWLVEPGDEVVEGQSIVVLEDRADITYTVVAPREGTVATFVAEERDRVEYGDTLGYILPLAE